MVPLTITVNGRTKQVGYIAGSTYYTPRLRSKHFFKKYNGYAISTAVLDILKFNYIETVVVIEKDTGKKYYTELNNFFEHGRTIPVRMSKEDNQIVLDIKWFKERV